MPEDGEPMQARGVRGLTNGFWAWCCLCLTVFGSPVVLADKLVEDESLLKAAFIYNFAKFTRWPLGTWVEQKIPLSLCTLGKDELVISLERLGKETIRGRTVAIKTVQAQSGAEGCHVLYIAGSEHRYINRLIELTQDTPVLTISEIRGFADSGGIIQLYRAKDRIRFKINLDVARDRGLQLSARLLDLAELVDQGAAR